MRICETHKVAYRKRLGLNEMARCRSHVEVRLPSHSLIPVSGYNNIEGKSASNHTALPSFPASSCRVLSNLSYNWDRSAS